MGNVLRIRDSKGNVHGIPGIQGEKGDKGDKGPKGDQGEKGADGKSAYELACDNGFEGTEAEWLATHCRGIYFGTSAPDASLGNDGDVYLMYTEE